MSGKAKKAKVRHPAVYSDGLLPYLFHYLAGYEKVLDVFGGTGKIRAVRADAVVLELEREWAEMGERSYPSGRTVQGDALSLPFADGAFDAVATSPVYGNRMSDSFTDYQTEKNYRRNTYTHAIGRKLDERNAGAIQWGERYREFHSQAWREVFRVLRPGGRFILNVKDHIRGGVVQRVSDWHIDAAVAVGFWLTEFQEVYTPGQRYGANGRARVGYENIFVFKKGERRKNGGVA